MPPDTNASESIWAQFPQLLKKAKKPAAYILLIVVAILEEMPGALHLPVVKGGAILALGLIIVHQLFDLKESMDVSKTQRSFKNISHAQEPILKYARESYRRGEGIHFQWLGITAVHAWSAVQCVLDELRDTDKVTDLKLEIALLNGEWLRHNKINEAWTQQNPELIMTKVDQYYRNPKIHELKWTARIGSYNHMPCFHGVLINGRYLLFGWAQWQQGDLHAGDCQYSLFCRDDSDDLEKIRAFESWFQSCAQTTVRKFPPSSNGLAQGQHA